MNASTYFLTQDHGLLRHWRSALGGDAALLSSVSMLLAQETTPGTLWLDLALQAGQPWDDTTWQRIAAGRRVIATSSNPSAEEGLAMLNHGCVGYVHAFAGAALLAQVHDVVMQGGVWIGQDVMQRLLGALRPAVPKRDRGWHSGLTERERMIAAHAADGLPNREIAALCGITERTVKAHLAAVFEKLWVNDRLQLALRVHGIR